MALIFCLNEEKKKCKTHLLRKHFSNAITKLLTVVFLELIQDCMQPLKSKSNAKLFFFPVDFYCSLTLHTRQPSFVPDLIIKSYRGSQSAKQAHSLAHNRLRLSLKSKQIKVSLIEQRKRIYY